MEEGEGEEEGKGALEFLKGLEEKKYFWKRVKLMIVGKEAGFSFIIV